MHTLIYESIYKHTVLTDFVLFNCNCCVKSVFLCSKSLVMRFPGELDRYFHHIGMRGWLL
ncbi:hypothetical protein TSAR_016477 [Trichomalopsis sarcophagae]|uniref:Uncharacterized protein n=1 Tax=Trichomalopsis sarcophagae TaxID=543379 RepID=A0A232EKN8_9HYME|nr:hypothetical protein TSAR_016477 [Trichomalopsis sarcophagae]